MIDGTENLSFEEYLGEEGTNIEYLIDFGYVVPVLKTEIDCIMTAAQLVEDLKY